ncbi:tetratricopeptide repeat protein [Aquimarina sp. MMG015]|uniref:tetratricopeptide repeat protein n=1 Tax=Aquimarina sp. MMG015 TaxID=2822689 RepID=UPI001B39D6FD|nr:tetratricopeptide repeat protein [Aquimarina sp. MMG015]MBQ4805145.1 tetratricopeptide repeat protein [Aquimarina sp. MMG015]
MNRLFASFFFFTFLCAFGQDLDTTLVRLQKEVSFATSDSAKVNALLSLAELQYDRDFILAKQLIEEAMQLINSNPSYINKQQLAKGYVVKGVINRREGNYPVALEFYLKAKEIYELENDTWHVSDVYHNMAMLYRYEKNHDKAITLYKKSIEIKKPLKDTHGIAAGYNMMGVSYRQTKKIDSALIYYSKAKELFTSINSPDDVQRVNNNMVSVYIDQNYYDDAKKLIIDNISYAKRNDKRYSLCLAYYLMSTIYKKSKQFDIGIKYADSSLAVSLKEGFKQHISKAYLRKSYLQHLKGNYKEAYFDYRKFNRYSDSVFNVENARKIQALELNHKFKKEKYADSLAFSQEKREVALLAEAEKSKKSLYMMLFFLTVLGATIIGFLVRRNYRNKAQIISEKLDKEKVQKELLDQKVIIKEQEIKRLVADNTMRLNFKEEMLDQLKKEIAEKTPEELKASLSSLTKELKSQINTEGKLSTIQQKINEVNQGFNAKLSELYPELTKTEREVCALLRLNLSIKEIMTIRGASQDAIKSIRYRIRKKIGLAPKEELEQFIQSL